MPTFICFLNWTDQGAQNAKDVGKRAKAGKAAAEKLGGRVLSAMQGLQPCEHIR